MIITAKFCYAIFTQGQFKPLLLSTIKRGYEENKEKLYFFDINPRSTLGSIICKWQPSLNS